MSSSTLPLREITLSPQKFSVLGHIPSPSKSVVLPFCWRSDIFTVLEASSLSSCSSPLSLPQPRPSLFSPHLSWLSSFILCDLFTVVLRALSSEPPASSSSPFDLPASLFLHLPFDIELSSFFLACTFVLCRLLSFFATYSVPLFARPSSFISLSLFFTLILSSLILLPIFCCFF